MRVARAQVISQADRSEGNILQEAAPYLRPEMTSAAKSQPDLAERPFGWAIPGLETFPSERAGTGRAILGRFFMNTLRIQRHGQSRLPNA